MTKKWPDNKTKAETTWIYVLRCPKTNAVRYVGATVNFRRRQLAYENGFCNLPICQWMHSLALEGLFPKMQAIDRVFTSQAKEVERRYIASYLEGGADLLNVHHGRKGVFAESLRKAKQSKRGKSVPSLGKLLAEMFAADRLAAIKQTGKYCRKK